MIYFDKLTKTVKNRKGDKFIPTLTPVKYKLDRGGLAQYIEY